jgi:hypothetical protein
MSPRRAPETHGRARRGGACLRQPSAWRPRPLLLLSLPRPASRLALLCFSLQRWATIMSQSSSRQHKAALVAKSIPFFPYLALGHAWPRFFFTGAGPPAHSRSAALRQQRLETLQHLRRLPPRHHDEAPKQGRLKRLGCVRRRRKAKGVCVRRKLGGGGQSKVSWRARRGRGGKGVKRRGGGGGGKGKHT